MFSAVCVCPPSPKLPLLLPSIALLASPPWDVFFCVALPRAGDVATVARRPRLPPASACRAAAARCARIARTSPFAFVAAQAGRAGRAAAARSSDRGPPAPLASRISGTALRRSRSAADRFEASSQACSGRPSAAIRAAKPNWRSTCRFARRRHRFHIAARRAASSAAGRPSSSRTRSNTTLSPGSLAWRRAAEGVEQHLQFGLLLQLRELGEGCAAVLVPDPRRKKEFQADAAGAGLRLQQVSVLILPRRKRAPASLLKSIVFTLRRAPSSSRARASSASRRGCSRGSSRGGSAEIRATSTASGPVKKLAARTASSRTRGCSSAAGFQQQLQRVGHPIAPVAQHRVAAAAGVVVGRGRAASSSSPRSRRCGAGGPTGLRAGGARTRRRSCRGAAIHFRRPAMTSSVSRRPARSWRGSARGRPATSAGRAASRSARRRSWRASAAARPSCVTR